MSSYVFDIETDGLLDDVSKIHCLVLKDIDTQEITHYEREDWYIGTNKLEKADLIIGHNIIKYDIPVLEKLFQFKTKSKIFDTLVATRLL